MSDPIVDSDFRTYRFKRKKYPFFANTDARLWSFQRFYTSTIYSEDAPRTFNEILEKWAASLKFIQKQKIPKSIVNFVEELIEFNESEKFGSLRDAYEQNFRAHILATISSGSVTKSEMAQGYMIQTNEILNSVLGEKDEEVLHTVTTENENFDAILDKKQMCNYNESTEESLSSKNKLKRKLEDVELLGYDGLAFLFNDLNENAIMGKIDEDTLEEESKLPLASDNKGPSKFVCPNVLNAFQKYQDKIPKIRKVVTPAYWGVLDLTRESLYGCKEISENDLQRLSQDFADHIKWKCEPAPKKIQDYFDSSCERLDSSDKDLKHFDTNIQFLKSNMRSFQGMLTEEQLKMTATFPLFHGTFVSDRIKHSWGEIQAISTSDARNEKSDPFKKARMGRKVDMKVTLLKTPNKFEALFGEVAGGLGPSGIPTACRKKRFLDKVKLMVTMRDSINRLLKECDYVSDEKRFEIVVFGWLQFGLELNFYAMDWTGSGIYRFGLLDRCRIPADDDCCSILEDSYCILKLLEKKLIDTEISVKTLFLNNTRGKRRQIALENKAELNVNRSPENKTLFDRG
ncbi:hypothetical protein Glove_226g27 [Diversispora epigaea]|uniref:Uncharacterized protein n=1 Tax=Diversispora epigaea TaxID=1348612 RepID=A0A397IEJ9_9GLOM|nr:hypothetical protein Glove_226g27 [Diversispora epigaea]